MSDNSTFRLKSFVLKSGLWYKSSGGQRWKKGRVSGQSGTQRKPWQGRAGEYPWRLARASTVAAMVMLTASCASLTPSTALPSCANVRGFYNPDIPLGAERIGSRRWIERRLIYTSQIGSVVRAVAAGPADGEWQAGRLPTPLLVEDGLWKTTIATGLAGQNPYDVNFDARAFEEPRFTTARIQRRTVEVYLHAFGPQLGNFGLERTIQMAALKYRGAPDTDWSICPVRW